VSNRTSNKQDKYADIPKRGGISTVVACVLNAIVFLVSSYTAFYPSDFIIPQLEAPMSVVPVVLSTLIGGLAGTIVYLFVARLAPNPEWTFRAIAGIAFLISCASPFSLTGAPTNIIIILIAMHALAALVVTVGLTVTFKMPKVPSRSKK
jgi:hypothetical protein